jgi:hypothetical protein
MNLSSIEDDDDFNDDYEVWMNSSSKYASHSKTKFRLPTIISSDSLNETNITVESVYNEKLGNVKPIRYNEFRYNEIPIVFHG